MNKKQKECHLKIDLKAAFAPLEKPIMLGETPSINWIPCVSELVVCSLPPRKFFSMAAVHAEIMERGFEVYLPQTMDEVYTDLDSILYQQPLFPSLTDAKKLVKSILTYHPITTKTK